MKSNSGVLPAVVLAAVLLIAGAAAEYGGGGSSYGGGVKHNDRKHNEVRHNDFKHDDRKHKDFKHNDRKHSDFKHHDDKHGCDHYSWGNEYGCRDGYCWTYSNPTYYSTYPYCFNDYGDYGWCYTKYGGGDDRATCTHDADCCPSWGCWRPDECHY